MTAINKQALRQTAEKAQEHGVFNMDIHSQTLLALLDELEHYKSREDRVTKLVLDNSTSWDELYKKLEAAEKRIAELLSENSGLNNSVENAAGCINAAYAEGLIDVLSESNDERLVYLVKRRLLFAYLPVETPATNEELIAMGDWVLREQLEDGTRAIKTLNRRIAELEARTVTLPPKEHDNGTDSQIDINAGFANRMWKKCADAIRAAGIGVKGE